MKFRNGREQVIGPEVFTTEVTLQGTCKRRQVGVGLAQATSRGSEGKRREGKGWWWEVVMKLHRALQGVKVDNPLGLLPLLHQQGLTVCRVVPPS